MAAAHNTSQGVVDSWEQILADYVRSRPTKPTSDGNLTIMGGGIGNLDLLYDVEQEIRRADIVMYCLADGITQALIENIRPDAIDLTALYGSGQPRYDTYVQMAETMIGPVRHGKSVAAVFYGHPGVFANPTHRAIRIARAEGLRAAMRPGISALDYLIADVGFDPAFPGMLNYEASDLLLRRRNIDTTLHLVVWQVGVVGEFGYSESGFRNIGYEQLIDRLAEAYGECWEVCHYIGSRFPGVPPVIDWRPLKQMKEPSVRSEIIPLSTFYIAPRDLVTDDVGAARALGVLSEAQSPSTVEPVSTRPLYGADEVLAVSRLQAPHVPPIKRYYHNNPGIRFFLDLRSNASLRAMYASDPTSALDIPEYSSLAPSLKRALASRSIRTIQQALIASLNKESERDQ